MKKYKCTNMECNYSCELRSDLFPHKCVCWDYIPQWVEMEELTTLPKLTAEVFDRPDCPEWANWAAVDSCGDAYFYAGKPQANSERWSDPVLLDFFYIGKFDATDWRNSLIERPAKALPEWMKEGEWVCYYEGKEYKYFKVARIVLNRLYGEDGRFSLMCDVGAARLRPYNAEEMKALVGKIIATKKDGVDEVSLVTKYASYNNHAPEVLLGSDNHWHSANGLFESEEHTLDGKPCGKFEHLENGEWVE